MYSGGSVVGKGSTIGIEISPTPLLIFTGGGPKVRNSASLNFGPPAFENAARYLNSEKKLSIIQPGIARFHSNFVQTLIT